MPLDLFHKLVEQYKTYIPNSPKSITLSAGAEPMVHPYFLELCEEIDQANIAFTFDTNATLMNSRMAEKLLSFKQFKRVAFSLDGYTANVYESIRRGAKFDKVVGNILNFLDLCEKCQRTDIKVEINMVLQDKNAHQVEDYILFWTPKVSQVKISALRNGTTFENPNWLPSERMPCNFLFDYMRVLTDGSVMVCCIDDKFTSKIGDTNIHTLAEIWNGENYRRLRESHENGDYGYFSICASCDAWAGFYPPRYFSQLTPDITLGKRPVNLVAFKTDKSRS
jgi:sulfatase maturation enzyme AslB (radical SAM superfamily)